MGKTPPEMPNRRIRRWVLKNYRRLTGKKRPLPELLKQQYDVVKDKQLAPMKQFYNKGNHKLGHYNGKAILIPRKARSPLVIGVGRSGSGKSKFFESQCESDMQAGLGTSMIDQSADLIRAMVMKIVAQSEQSGSPLPEKFRYISFTHDDWVIPLSLTCNAFNNPRKQVNEVVTLLERKFNTSISDRQRELLKKLILTLILTDKTIQHAEDILLTKPYRKVILNQLKQVPGDWSNLFRYWHWYNNLSVNQQKNYVQSLLYKLSSLLENEYLKHALCCQGGINFWQLINGSYQTFIDLDPVRLFDDTNTIASLILIQIKNAIQQASQLNLVDRIDHVLYTDEIQGLINNNADEFTYFSQVARKLGMTVYASFHQPSALPKEILESLFNNATTTVCFQLRDYKSAYLMARQLYKKVKPSYEHPLFKSQVSYYGHFEGIEHTTEHLMSMPIPKAVISHDWQPPTPGQSFFIDEPPYAQFKNRWRTVTGRLLEKSELNPQPRSSVAKEIREEEKYLHSYRTSEQRKDSNQAIERRWDLWQ